MKHYSFLAVAATAVLTVTAIPVLAEQRAPSLIYETPREFFGSGDFDKDGRADLVIVDKESGKYRLGYQLTPGVFSWVDCRPSGIKGVAGFSIGQLLATNQEALGLYVARRQPDHAGGRLQPDRPGQASDRAVYGGAGTEYGRGGGHRRRRQDRPRRSLCRLHLQLARPEPGDAAAQRWRGVSETGRGAAGRSRRAGQPAFAQSGPAGSCCACWCRRTKGTRCARRISAAASRWRSPPRRVCPPARIMPWGISAARPCASSLSISRATRT